MSQSPAPSSDHDTLYLPLSGQAGDAPAFEAAVALAAALHVEVDAVFLGADDAAALMMSGDGVAGLGLGAVEALSAEREAAEARARAMAGDRDGFHYRVHGGARVHGSAPARLSPFAIVEPSAARGVGPLSDVFQTLLVEDGAAVLIPRGPIPPKRLGVAWDGSREAARSLKMARDLVGVAEHVVILQAKAGLSPKDVACADPSFAAAWIARRGPSTEVATFDARGAPGDELLAAAEAAGVELLIAGAYGHTRLRQAVFGGVTRTLLEAEAPSLFMAH